MSRRAFFSLGSNIGDRVAHLTLGVHTVASDDPYRISQVYETEPVGGVEQESFFNLVVELVTEASALELLEIGRAHV